MKTLNPGFAAAAASLLARPVTLAVFHFPSGDLCVSDRRVEPEGGPVFEPLVVSWDEITAPFTGAFGFRMPRTSLRISNSGPAPFASLLESSVPERTEVELYQWFEGIPYSDREPLGRFVISSPVGCEAGHVELALVCSAVTNNRIVGRTINRDDYPGADPDAVGRTASIIYGSVEGLFCPAVSAGAATTLSADVDAAQTTGISLSMAPTETPFPGSGTLQVGREKIAYTGMTANTLTGVTRGASGTTASPHRKGDTMYEVRSSYEYLVAGHPVKSIGEVYVGGVRVESGVTRLTDDAGVAKLVFSEKFSLEKSVDLDVDEGSHEHAGHFWSGSGSRTSTYRWTASANPGWTAGEHAGRAFLDSAGNYFFIKANGQNYLDLASIHGKTPAAGTYEGRIIRTQVEPLYQDTLSSNFNAPASGSPASLCDKGWNSYCTIQVSTGYIKTTRSESVSDKGIIVGAKLCGTYGNSGIATGTGCRSEFEGGPFNGQYITGGGTSVQTVRTSDTLTRGSNCTWQDFSGSVLKASYTGSTSGSYWEHWVEVYYIPYSGGASPASGVRLTGDSAADFVVGGTVTCDAEGYADDGTGSYTGTPGALIKNPADVIGHFMRTQLELDPSGFGASFSDARAKLDGLGYSLAGVIDAPVDGLDLVDSLCMQARMKLSHDGLTATAEVAEGAPALPDRVVTTSMIKSGSLRVSRTGREEIINRLSVHYRRDLSGKGSSRFMEVADSSAAYPSAGDPASVSVYGPKGPRRPFALGFVRDGQTASSLRDFYIGRYKDAVRRVNFTVFLDNIGLEPGDVVGLEWDLGGMDLTGALFEVEKVSFRPGGLSSGRPDELAVQAREVS